MRVRLDRTLIRGSLSGRLAVVVLSALLPMAAFGQEATVRGTITDARSGEPLALANVMIEGTAIGTSADAGGRYLLRQVPPGEVVLVVSHVGYAPSRRRLRVAPGEAASADFALRPADFEPGELVVEAEVPLREERALGLQQMPIQLVRRIPSAIEDDLFRSLQLLPGVKTASDFSSRLFIRGGSPDQTLILLDRTPVYNPSHFFGFFSIFNIDAIEDVRVWKSAYPVRYGGRLGSVIDVTTRGAERARFGGGVSVGLLASRLRAEGPVRLAGIPGGVFVAARRSTLEPLLAALRQLEDNIPESFYFYDLNARLDLEPGPGHRLTASFYTGLNDVVFPFAEGARFDLVYGNRLGTLRYRRIFLDRLVADVQASASRYWSYPFAEVAGTSFERENTITDLSLRADAEWLGSDRLTVRGGVAAGSLSRRLNDRFDGRPTLQATTANAYGSAYAEAAWERAPWVLTGGMRAEYFSRGGYLRFGPRVSVERYLGENVLLQAAYGRYHQFLSLVSNEVFTGFDVWVTAAEGVPPAFGDQFTLGIKTRPGPAYAVDVELYYRTMRDLFELDPRLQDLVGVEYPDLFRTGEGYAAGFEVLLERRRGALTGFVAYTLGVTQRRFVGPRGEAFNPDPVTGAPRLFSPKFDRRHDLAVVANYELGRGWSLTGAFVYASGQAYTRVSGHYAVPTLPGVDAGVVVTTGFNRARLPAYHRLDLGLTREGRLLGVADYELRIQAINAYSRRNMWFYFLDQRSNPIELRPARQLPILPNISFSVDF